jgi:hypothetical protein
MAREYKNFLMVIFTKEPIKMESLQGSVNIFGLTKVFSKGILKMV